MEKVGKCIKKGIKQCDAFGTFISFRINEDLEYKSMIGGISTILFVIATLIYVFYNSYNFLSRSNVDFIFTNKILETGPFVNLTSSQFNIAFGIQFSDTDIEAETPALSHMKDYFTYKMTMTEWVGVDDIFEYQFGFKNCEKSDFYNIVDDAFDTNLLGALLCPVFNSTTNYTIEGTYTDYFYKFIELEVNLSEKGLEEKDEVRRIMETTPMEMAIFWLDTGIDYENRGNAMPSFINYSYKSIDFDFTKTTELFISTIEFKNDDNLMWDNTKTTLDAMLDRSVDSFRLINDRVRLNEYCIGKFEIKASSKVIQVSRKYQKFPSFIADLTSLLEEILVLLMIMVNFVERKAVDHKLIEKMLKFRGSKYFDVDYLINVFNKDRISNGIMDMIEKQNLNIERKNNIATQRKSIMVLLNNRKEETHKLKNRLSSFKFDDQKSNNKFLEPIDSHDEEEENQSEMPYSSIKNESRNNKKYNTNDELNRNIEMISNSLSSKKNSVYYKNDEETETSQNGPKTNTISLSKSENLEETYKTLNICSIIWASMCFWTSRKQKKRNLIIEQAEKKIHYYLDIYTYIKKMQEIDIIKYSLYDEDQLTLFKFLSKPPVKMGINSFGVGIYKEFEETQHNYTRIGKKEIDLLFKAYNTIRNKEEISFEDLKLLRLVKAEVDFLKN